MKTMIVTTSLSRRGLVRAGGGLLLTGILPIDDSVSDGGRGLQGRGADRFERAEEFYRGVAAGLYRHPHDLLYKAGIVAQLGIGRSEEHTSELQSLMRTSYAVFCLKNKINTSHNFRS